MYIFVKVYLGSSYSIAVPDCNNTSSLEACNCIIRANSPVFTTFYFRFCHWSFWTKLIATTRLKTFQYHLVWTCIHKKLIACHSPNFKICVGSRIILPGTVLQPTKTDDRKRSNWPPDVNQIVFHWPPRRSIWKFTARVTAKTDQTGRMPRGSRFSMDTPVILLVLSCSGSNETHHEKTCLRRCETMASNCSAQLQKLATVLELKI